MRTPQIIALVAAGIFLMGAYTPGVINPGTSGQLTYYGATGTTISGNPNATISAGQLSLGQNAIRGSVVLHGATSGQTLLIPGSVASGTLTLPSATDTLLGRATTDTLTNKTFDTGATGNLFLVHGVAISGLGGTTGTLGTMSGSLTNGHCLSLDASHNIVDSGTTCGGTTLTAGNGIFISVGNVISTSLTNTTSSKSADYTVAAGDMGGVIGLSSGSAHNLTLPVISGTVFGNNTSTCYQNEGLGTWTIINSTGGTLLGLPSSTIKTGGGGCFWSDGANLHWVSGQIGGDLYQVSTLGSEFTNTSNTLHVGSHAMTAGFLFQATAHTLVGNNTGSTADQAAQSSFSITAASSINANAASLLTAQTGTLMQIQQADGVQARYEADAFGAPAFFTSVVANGTKASPTTITSATQLGGFNFFGYDGTSYGGPAATFRAYGNQTWTNSAHGSYATVATTPNASTTLTDVLKFEHDGGMTTPAVTGGDKGAGTLNAAGLYVNGLAVATAGGTIKSQYVNQMSGSVLFGTPKYYVPMGSDGGSGSNNVASAMISALNGTISSLYVRAVANAGGSSSSGGFVYTVFKNNVATSMTCSIAFNASPVTCNDTAGGHAITVVIGDLISIEAQMTANGSGGWSTSVAAMEFDAS